MAESSLPPLSILSSALARDKRMTGRKYRALMALAAHRNRKTKVCFPKHKTLSQDTGMAVREVRMVLKELKADGLIEWEQQRREDGSLTSNIYRLPFMDELDDVLNAQEGDVPIAQEGDVQDAQEGDQHEAQEGDVQDAPTKDKEIDTEGDSEGDTESIIEFFPGGSSNQPEIKKGVEGKNRQKQKQSKTELRKDWKPTEKQRLFCKDQGYDPDEVAEEFRDFFHADGIPMLDWDGAWINFVSGRKEYLEKAERNRQRIARNRKTA